MLNYKKPAFWVIVVAVVACAVVTVCFATNPSEKNTIKQIEADRVVISHEIEDGVYDAQTTITDEEIVAEIVLMHNTIQIQEMSRPMAQDRFVLTFYSGEDTVTTWWIALWGDGTIITAADTFGLGNHVVTSDFDYDRLAEMLDSSIDVANTVGGRKLTLEDVATLSQKGDSLTWSDFEPYQGREVGSGLYIMRYEINELFDVLVGGVPNEMPWYIYLRVNNKADDRIDIRTDDVPAFIMAHYDDLPKDWEPAPDGGGKPAPEEPDFSTLSDERTAIQRAILVHNRSAVPTELVPCASFVELACVVEDWSDFSQYIHYGWALYEEYEATDGGLKTVVGRHIPVAITLREDLSGTLTLEEYWEPRDGSYYAQDIREKFPAHIAEDGMDSQKFILRQEQECHAQAVASTGLDTNKVIGTLIETICSSPALSSNPGDYINEHLIEYRELTYYGRHTLKYCFTEFLKGGQTDLRGHIMRAAIGDIAPEAQINFDAETGQEYFDAWKDAAMSVREQHDMDWIEKYQPAIYLFLQMINEYSSPAQSSNLRDYRYLKTKIAALGADYLHHKSKCALLPSPQIPCSPSYPTPPAGQAPLCCSQNPTESHPLSLSQSA